MTFQKYLSAAGLARLSLIALSLIAGIAPARAQVPGGFVEKPNTAVARPALTASQVQSFLPARGGFTFPSPYHTRGARITNATDCGGGDCVWAVGYSYWRNINNHTGSNLMYLFVGLNQNLGGTGPTLFSYNKTTEEVRNLGPLFAAGSGPHSRSGEGFYFSGTRPTALYVDDGPRMLRYDVLTKTSETVFDVRAQYGSDRTIWQMHSSDDDRVHSATLRDGSGRMLGCVVYDEPAGRFSFFAAKGNFNECEVDKSGRWLTINDNIDGIADDEMRVIELGTGIERVVYDQDGAIGHYDAGHGYTVGTDNWSNLSNAYKAWDFSAVTLTGLLVSYNNDWSAAGPNHISHTNARAGVPMRDQYACGSSATSASAVWGNEVVCFRLDGQMNVAVVAPVMTNMNAASGGDSYNKQPKGNLDVTGGYFVWTSNTGGTRVDAFIVKVPSQLMVGSAPAPDTNAPTVAITSPPTGSTVSGTVNVTASASDDVGVAGVQFQLDGMNWGAEDTAAPFAIAWDTTTALAGVHTITAIARDAAGNLALATPVFATVLVSEPAPSPTPDPVPPPPPSDGGEPVAWTSLVNVTATGNSLKKTGGCDGCADAGAVSSQRIPSGDGWLEFTMSETTLVRHIGLSKTSTGTGAAEIRHALKIVNASAEVRELGKYRRATGVVTGDVLRIAVTSGVVKYSKNGVVFHTSSLAPQYPLLADSALSSRNSTLADVRMGGVAVAVPTGPQAVTWTDRVNVGVAGTVLTKTGGCDGCEDAGAVSQQQIASGDGYFEFTVSETNYVRYVGLNPNSTGTGNAEIPHGFKLVNGTAEVRELGVYKWDTAVATGDVLRIAVQSGVVKYSKNGVVFYTSATAAAYPLRVDTALASSGATIAGAVLAATQPAQMQPSSTEVTSPAVTSAGAIDLRWLALLLAGLLARASTARRAQPSCPASPR